MCGEVLLSVHHGLEFLGRRVCPHQFDVLLEAELEFQVGCLVRGGDEFLQGALVFVDPGQRLLRLAAVE